MPSSRPLVLVVDDEASIRELIQAALERLNLRVLTAGDGSTALSIFFREEPKLVLTDIVMNGMSGLDLLRRIKAYRPETVVVVFTAYSSEEKIIEALRAGATDYLKKPFDLKSLVRSVQNALQVQATISDGRLEIDSVVREEKILELDNDPVLIAGAIRQVTICAPKYLSRERCLDLSVALHEMILNAMEHGNLGVTPEEKNRRLLADDYQRFLTARRADPGLVGRKVRITYRLDDKGLHYTVQDQGPGFDWRSRRVHSPRASVAQPHGRGLRLAEFYASRLEFNETGNEAYLTFFREDKGD
ncbi:MAG: response regulator [Thermodesulfobacteriota bacterium]